MTNQMHQAGLRRLKAMITYRLKNTLKELFLEIQQVQFQVASSLLVNQKMIKWKSHKQVKYLGKKIKQLQQQQQQRSIHSSIHHPRKRSSEKGSERRRSRAPSPRRRSRSPLERRVHAGTAPAPVRGRVHAGTKPSRNSQQLEDQAAKAQSQHSMGSRNMRTLKQALTSTSKDKVKAIYKQVLDLEKEIEDIGSDDSAHVFRTRILSKAYWQRSKSWRFTPNHHAFQRIKAIKHIARQLMEMKWINS